MIEDKSNLKLYNFYSYDAFNYYKNSHSSIYWVYENAIEQLSNLCSKTFDLNHLFQ